LLADRFMVHLGLLKLVGHHSKPAPRIIKQLLEAFVFDPQFLSSL
jgi:hypothetical protein